MRDRKRRLAYLVPAALALLVAAVAAYVFLVRHHLDAAEKALVRREYSEALGHARAALRFWPWQARAHLLAARAERGEGRLAEAEEHLDEAERRGADAESI